MASRGIESCKRVIWRLREQEPEYLNNNRYSLKQLRRAIMMECGTCERTIKERMNTLLELGWIKRYSRNGFKVTKEYED
tara:strand:+ start:1068 stop:1304 length:237 start_codon:yes stop_codon:yes gene_type:complete